MKLSSPATDATTDTRAACRRQMALTLTDLRCERGGRLLFKSLSVELQSGSGLRIVGTNGSGKTTLLRVMTGLSQHYSGQVTWGACDIRRSSLSLRRDTLYIGHAPGINDLLTPLENLRWWMGLHSGEKKNSEAIDRALSAVGLLPFAETPCQQLSAGQKRRTALARLYLSEHPLWILDEPFTAIDTDGVCELESILARKIAGGGIVVLTTHQTLTTIALPELDIDLHNSAMGSPSEQTVSER